MVGQLARVRSQRVPQAGERVRLGQTGNHGQGVAYAARMFGIRAVVVMPSDAPNLKIENTRALGAQVVLYEEQEQCDREPVRHAIEKERRDQALKRLPGKDHSVSTLSTLNREGLDELERVCREWLRID